jgi:hypothetical protein
MHDLICKYGNLLEFRQGVYKEKNEFIFNNCFFFQCNKCGEIYLPDIVRSIVDGIIDCILRNNASLEGDFRNVAFTFWDKEFQIINDFPYKICKEDYYCFPGLYRDFNVGFLAPLYFNIEVLLKYIYNPKYNLSLDASTYGSISNGEANIQFGINENNKVLMWYSDVCNLPINEQYYLLSENVESDHCILSEFYMTQIQLEWAQPSEVNKLIKNRSTFNKNIEERYQITFHQLELETLKIIKDIKPLIISTEEYFNLAINPLNMIFVESINSKEIKKLLKTLLNINLENKKGLKLFEIFINEVLNVNNGSSEISPLFVLYDLRIYCSHLQSDEDRIQMLKNCNQRLGLDENVSDYQLIYNTLINKLNTMYNTLITLFTKDESQASLDAETKKTEPEIAKNRLF